MHIRFWMFQCKQTSRRLNASSQTIREVPKIFNIRDASYIGGLMSTDKTKKKTSLNQPTTCIIICSLGIYLLFVSKAVAFFLCFFSFLAFFSASCTAFLAASSAFFSVSWLFSLLLPLLFWLLPLLLPVLVS